MSTDNELARAALEKRMRAQGYVTVRDLTSKLGMHVNSVYRWVNEGEVSAIKIGRTRFITLASVVKKIGHEAAEAVGLLQRGSPPKAGKRPEVEVEVEQ